MPCVDELRLEGEHHARLELHVVAAGEERRLVDLETEAVPDERDPRPAREAVAPVTRELERQVVEPRAADAGLRRQRDVGHDRAGVLVSLPQLVGDGTERERPRLVAEVAERGADQVDDHRLAAPDRPGRRALSDEGVRPDADERRVGATGLGGCRARGDRPVVDLAVEAPHAQDPLMALTAQPGLDLGRELDLGHALPKGLRRRSRDAGEHRGRLADPVELPEALARRAAAARARSSRRARSPGGGSRSRGSGRPAARRARSRSPAADPAAASAPGSSRSERRGSIRASGDSRARPLERLADEQHRLALRQGRRDARSASCP